MCDWQLADRARGGRDLGYFLTQSLDPGVRRDLQDDLVDLYVERLAANGVTGYGRDEAWEDYRVAALFSLLYPVVAGGGLELSGSRAALLTEVILVRAAEAIVDLDCTSLG
jgi:Ecdysteroid kinase-like family